MNHVFSIMATAETSIRDLPPELLQQVYSYLDDGELLKLYITSKFLSSAIPRSRWRCLYIDLFTRKEMWDRSCDHYGSRDHSGSVKRVFYGHSFHVSNFKMINGELLPMLCNQQAAMNILPYIEKLMVSVTYDEPTPVQTRINSTNNERTIIFASPHPFFELFVKILLPKYRPLLKEIRIQAVISERTQNPPIDILMSYFPESIKHVWLYAQGIGGMCNLNLKGQLLVKQLGICYESSMRDYTFTLIGNYIGPFLPLSTETLVLCGDVTGNQLTPWCGSRNNSISRISTLVVNTVNLPQMCIPESVKNLSINGDYNLTSRILDVSNIWNFEMTALGNAFHLPFGKLKRLTVAFWPRPGRWRLGRQSATQEIVERISSSLSNNPPLEQFRCTGLSIQSMVYLIKTTNSMKHLTSLAMNQPREHFREKLDLTRWNLVELCRRCSELDNLLFTNLNRDDISTLVNGGHQIVHDLCPLITEFKMVTDWPISSSPHYSTAFYDPTLIPISCPIQPGLLPWINLDISCQYAYSSVAL